MITKEELEAIKQIVKTTRIGCLCGHDEWCPSCSGENDNLLKLVCKRLDDAFLVGNPNGKEKK